MKKSTVVRRNSSIEIIRSTQGSTVVKKYHDTYVIDDEIDKLGLLSSFFKFSDKFRCVKVLSSNNSRLELEYIDGVDFGKLNNNQLNLIRTNISEFNALFLQCHMDDFSFDSDLSNIFYSRKEEKFIFIDPVQVNLELPHLAFVVFTLSILKSLGKSSRFYLMPKKLRLFNVLLREYANMIEVDRSALRNSYNGYIQNVIKWNGERTISTTFGSCLVRKFLLIPVWKIVQRLILIQI